MSTLLAIAGQTMVAAIFTCAVLHKARSRQRFLAFAKSIAQLPLVPDGRMATALAGLLLAAKATAVGAVLYPATARAGTALAAALFLMIAMVALALARSGRGEMSGCFGRRAVLGETVLARNVLLAAVATAAALQPEGALTGVRHWQEHPGATSVAVATAIGLALLFTRFWDAVIDTVLRRAVATEDPGTTGPTADTDATNTGTATTGYGRARVAIGGTRRDPAQRSHGEAAEGPEQGARLRRNGSATSALRAVDAGQGGTRAAPHPSVGDAVTTGTETESAVPHGAKDSTSTVAENEPRTRDTAGMEDGARNRVHLSDLLPYLRPQLRLFLVITVLSLVAAFGLLAQPLLVRSALDRIERAEPLAGFLSLVVLVLVGAALVSALRDYLLQRVGEGVVLAVRQQLATQLLRMPMREYDQRRAGDLLARLGADTTLLRSVVTSGILDLLSGAVMLAGAVIMMVILDPLLFAVTLFGLVGALSALVVARRVQGVSVEAQHRLGEMTSATERALSGMRTIRAARAENRETETIVAAARLSYQAGLRMAKLKACIGPMMTTAVQIAFLALLGVGGSRVAAGTITIGDLVAFVFLLFLLMMPLLNALGAYAEVQKGLGALRRVEEILALGVERDEERPESAVPAAAEPGSGQSYADVPPTGRPGAPAPRPERSRAHPPSATGPDGAGRRTFSATSVPAVEFDRVSFSYDDGPPVLQDVSFTVPRGTRCALVGPSGGGKSTALALVERFYDTTAGSVLVNGINVRDQPRQLLRAQLGYVEQDAPVLAGTIRENLLLADPGVTDEELYAALAAANLTELATRAADGLDTHVGDGGMLLSGGQRQRLALARTLLSHPPVLLLDEPTSNLDARHEFALRQAIETAAEDRTLIVVAHRLSTVVDADQIVVFDGGRVVASGAHDELTATSPLYHELAAHQLLVK